MHVCRVTKSVIKTWKLGFKISRLWIMDLIEAKVCMCIQATNITQLYVCTARHVILPYVQYYRIYVCIYKLNRSHLTLKFIWMSLLIIDYICTTIDKLHFIFSFKHCVCLTVRNFDIHVIISDCVNLQRSHNFIVTLSLSLTHSLYV